jgi:hypothetical protein
MARGPWLSGSRRAKAKDPEGTTTMFQKKYKKWGLRLLWLKREYETTH